MKETLTDFFEEKKLVSRWVILLVALIGGFAGAILMFMIALMGIIS